MRLSTSLVLLASLCSTACTVAVPQRGDPNRAGSQSIQQNKPQRGTPSSGSPAPRPYADPNVPPPLTAKEWKEFTIIFREFTREYNGWSLEQRKAYVLKRFARPGAEPGATAEAAKCISYALFPLFGTVDITIQRLRAYRRNCLLKFPPDREPAARETALAEMERMWLAGGQSFFSNNNGFSNNNNNNNNDDEANINVPPTPPPVKNKKIANVPSTPPPSFKNKKTANLLRPRPRLPPPTRNTNKQLPNYRNDYREDALVAR